MDKKKLLSFAEAIDQLVNIDVSGRGIISLLYSLAREKMGEPLALRAAENLMSNVREKSAVFICTGWIHRPYASKHTAETDGPPGAATLARALNKAFRAVPSTTPFLIFTY